jgi:hypothetical protein
MKKTNLIVLLLLCMSCYSQKNTEIIKSIDLSANQEMNYIFARIHDTAPFSKELFKRGLFVRIFELSDSKATPEGLFEGYDGIVSSFIISVSPDGDYYSGSELYKIEGLILPKIIAVKELEFPFFSVEIEHGFYDQRETKIFEFDELE